jgi:hypothetical protein
LLICGGIATSGRLYVVGVLGAYWISSNTSERWTTSPGVMARFPPTVNGRPSTVEGMPRLRRASCRKCRAPVTRLRPRVATALLSAPGFPTSVLVGATASVNSERAKRARSRLFASISTSSTSPVSALASTR